MTIKLKSHKSPRKPIIITSSVILILALAGGGLFYYQKTQKKVATTQEVKSAETEKPEVKATETSNVAEVKTEIPKEAKEPVPVTTSTPAAPKPTPLVASNPPKQPATTPTPPKTPTTTPSVPTTTTATPTASNSVYALADAQNLLENEILRLVNAERAALGVPPLAFDAKLRQAADIRAREEAIPSFVGTDHTRPDGRSWSTVLSDVGYAGATAWGENLAWGYQSQFTYTDSQLKTIASKMFTGWKNSPGHYAQIKDPKYNQTGIGVVLLNQSGRTYWFGNQLFARR